MAWAYSTLERAKYTGGMEILYVLLFSHRNKIRFAPPALHCGNGARNCLTRPPELQTFNEGLRGHSTQEMELSSSTRPAQRIHQIPICEQRCATRCRACRIWLGSGARKGPTRFSSRAPPAPVNETEAPFAQFAPPLALWALKAGHLKQATRPTGHAPFVSRYYWHAQGDTGRHAICRQRCAGDG